MQDSRLILHCMRVLLSQNNGFHLNCWKSDISERDTVTQLSIKYVEKLLGIVTICSILSFGTLRSYGVGQRFEGLAKSQTETPTLKTGVGYFFLVLRQDLLCWADDCLYLNWMVLVTQDRSFIEVCLCCAVAMLYSLICFCYSLYLFFFLV